MTDRRVAVAFCVAPAVCAPVFILGNFFALFIADGTSAFRDLLALTIGGFVVVLPVAYIAEGVLGIPLFLILRSRYRLNRSAVIVGGGTIGVVGVTLAAMVAQAIEPAMFIAGGSGIVAAAFWWRIATGDWAARRDQRPDSALPLGDRQ
jgi:hypothetical protein